MTEDRYKNDAWKIYDELMKRFTQTTEVRRDLIVRGLATERKVEFTLTETNYGSPLPRSTSYHTTTRNVGTMRELAKALNDACDFVERSNPEWAKIKENRGETSTAILDD